MSWVWKYSPHGGSELLALLGLGDFSDDDGRSYPSVKTLATKIRLSPRMTKRVLKSLADQGAIEVEKNAGPRACNVYRIIQKDGPAVGVRWSPVSAWHRGQDDTWGHADTGDSLDRDGDIFSDSEVSPVTPKPSETPPEPSKIKARKARASESEASEVLPFASDVFRAAWAEWRQHLREKKKPLGQTAAARQLAKLRDMGEARALAAIENSIANNWQGIFEPIGAASPQPRETW
jgi:hypothetical protein